MALMVLKGWPTATWKLPPTVPAATCFHPATLPPPPSLPMALVGVSPTPPCGDESDADAAAGVGTARVVGTTCQAVDSRESGVGALVCVRNKGVVVGIVLFVIRRAHGQTGC